MIDAKSILKSVFFGRGANPVFGLDIGSHSVKVAYIKKGIAKAESHLSFAVASVPEGGLREGVINAIRQAVKNLAVDSKRVNISLSGQNIIARYLLMPKMAEKDLANSLEFELAKHMPQKFEDMVIDYRIIDKSLDNHVSIMVVGAERKFINEKVELIKQAGFEPQAINIDCFAISEAFGNSSPSLAKSAEAVALLNIGHKITNLAVLEGGILRFSRDIMFGGHDITKALSERMNIDLASAEKLKCSPKDNADTDKIVKVALNTLLDEIHLSFDYCERIIQKKVSAIYLSGGSAYLKDIDKLLNNILMLKVNFWNPLDNFKLLSKLSPQELSVKSRFLAVAIGLAF